MSLKSRVERIEANSKLTLSTAHQVIEYFLRAQRGEVSIHGAVISEALLHIGTDEKKWFQLTAEELAKRYDMPVEQVQRELVARNPALALYL